MRKDARAPGGRGVANTESSSWWGSSPCFRAAGGARALLVRSFHGPPGHRPGLSRPRGAHVRASSLPAAVRDAGEPRAVPCTTRGESFSTARASRPWEWAAPCPGRAGTRTPGSASWRQENAAPEPSPARVSCAASGVSSGALGVRLLEGRLPEPGRPGGQPIVVVVNRRARPREFPGSPVGREIDLWGTKTRIVGVVGDVKDAPRPAAAEPALFWPVSQQPFRVEVWSRCAPAAIRSHLVSAARTAVTALDPELPLAEVRTPGRHHARRTRASARFLLACVLGPGVFGGGAGRGGRLRGAGLRGGAAPAAGARRACGPGRDARTDPGLVVGQGLRLAAAGLCLGTLLRSLSGRVLEGQLYGSDPREIRGRSRARSWALALVAVAGQPPARAARRPAQIQLVVLRAEWGRAG
jgi:hypothetical protein